MSEIKLYIACSLDGYIARKNGKLDWLMETTAPEGEDYGYHDLLETIDTVLMGRVTYEEIIGFDVPWPYLGKHCVVFSSGKTEITSPNTAVISEINSSTLKKLKAESEKNLWLVGGGQIIKRFLELKALDEIIITVIPRRLGEGIPLFPPGIYDQPLVLQKARSIKNGAVMLTYRPE
jgi:dihydrofolate reductase